MRLDGLAHLVLQQVRACAVKYTGRAAGDRRGVPTGVQTFSACLEPVQADVGVVEKRVKDADGIRATTHAGSHRVGQAAGQIANLPASLPADHLLEVTNQHRERMRSRDCAEQIVGVRRRWSPSRASPR